MDVLKAMSIFVRVVESGSLTAAAQDCGLSPTMVGNHLQALEARLGTRLMHRTTRKQQLSAFGHAYYERCIEILDLVGETDRLALNQHATPRGHLRLTAPVTFGNECLIPALADYCRRYPDVKLDIAVTDSLPDLMEDGFEAAIRLGKPATPELVARPLQPYRLLLCAAPSYLADHGTPGKPEDLAAHQCLTYAYPLHSELRSPRPAWMLTGPDGPISIPVEGRLQVDSADGLRRAALAGMGIAMLPSVMVADDIRAGRLAEVLAGRGPAARPLNLLYLRDRLMTAKLRTFVDFVVERFGQPRQP
ncbi:MAG TPA: LysR family transcriptional regulator [Bordetella sp.]